MLRFKRRSEMIGDESVRVSDITFCQQILLMILTIVSLLLLLSSKTSSVSPASLRMTIPDYIPMDYQIFQQPVIEIPSFFDKLGNEFDFQTNCPFCDESVPEYLRRVAEPMEQAQRSGQDKIFISIPSYRDQLCSGTIENIFKFAQHPERVFVGICDQLVPGEDTELACKAPEQWKGNVRTITMSASDAKGPVLARYLTSKLWDGEKWYFSIDAHTDFIQDWDEILVDMLNHHHDKALVTHYPVARKQELGDNQGRIPLLCKGGFRGAPRHLIKQECGECLITERIDSSGTCLGTFIGAGFIFGRSTMLRDAPFDRYLDWLFQGEELIWAARLWTSGWRFYSPSTNVVNHVYGQRAHSIFRERASNLKHEEEVKALERVYYVLGLTGKVPERSQELEYLGGGSQATMQQYQEFAGLNLSNSEIDWRCYKMYDEVEKRWYDPKQ